MSAVTTLRSVRERMSDPNRVVLDPDSTYEKADGSCDGRGSADFYGKGVEPDRACLLGWLWVFEGARYGEPEGTAAAVVAAVLNQRYASVDSVAHDEYETQALADGVYLEVLDAAITRQDA